MSHSFDHPPSTLSQNILHQIYSRELEIPKGWMPPNKYRRNHSQDLDQQFHLSCKQQLLRYGLCPSVSTKMHFREICTEHSKGVNCNKVLVSWSLRMFLSQNTTKNILPNWFPVGITSYNCLQGLSGREYVHALVRVYTYRVNVAGSRWKTFWRWACIVWSGDRKGTV